MEQNTALRQEVETTVQQSAIEAGRKAFDADIASLGDDFKEIFGEGSYNQELQSSNPSAFKQRMAVLNNIVAIEKGYSDADRPSKDKILKMAVFNVTGKMPGDKAKPDIDTMPDKLKAHAEKVVGKPSGSTKQNTVAGELSQAIKELDEALGH